VLGSFCQSATFAWIATHPPRDDLVDRLQQDIGHEGNGNGHLNFSISTRRQSTAQEAVPAALRRSFDPAACHLGFRNTRLYGAGAFAISSRLSAGALSSRMTRIM
jgi:hypothetical protein